VVETAGGDAVSDQTDYVTILKNLVLRIRNKWRAVKREEGAKPRSRSGKRRVS